MATEVKPGVKFQPPDWFTNGFAISSNSERQRDASHEVRQQVRFLRNETDNKTKWDQYDNNTRLSDRIDVVRKWRETLEKTHDDLDKEIAALNDAKEETERSLEAKNLQTDVNNECLTMRDGRRGIDNVEDESEHQLRKEQELIEKVKKILQQKIDESFEQLCLLQEARTQVVADLQDKNIAQTLDIEQYNLNEFSPNLSYKPDPSRIPKGTTNPQQWEDFSRYNMDRSKAEIGASQRLREAIHHTLHQTDNDLEAQKQATEYAMRKRIHETERAKDELEWQKKNMEDEIAEMEKDLRNLEEAIRAKIPSTKLAETRNEHRTYRPNVELCRDAAQYGLTDEIKQLYATVDALKEKQRQARHALGANEKQLARINEDLANKENTLMLDKRCMDTRTKLDTKPMTQSDCNMLTQGIIREKSKVIA